MLADVDLEGCLSKVGSITDEKYRDLSYYMLGLYFAQKDNSLAAVRCKEALSVRFDQTDRLTNNWRLKDSFCLRIALANIQETRDKRKAMAYIALSDNYEFRIQASRDLDGFMRSNGSHSTSSVI